jgi:hypothetical protein
MYSTRSFRGEVGARITEVEIPNGNAASGINILPIHPEGLSQVSSYNWIEGPTATIMVPGRFRGNLLIRRLTRKWASPTLPARIPQDHGLRYVDQNAARCPAYPLEPLFRSVFAVAPTFDPKPFQLVTDRNNLRKLAWVVIGESIDNFRIDIELVGNTMLFTRWEKASTETVLGFQGFGHQFEKHFTSYPEEVKRSTGHHRVIQYTLGTIKMLLRFEVDGYVQGPQTTPTPSPPSSDIEDITSLLQSARLGSDVPQVPTYQHQTESNVKVLRGGFTVPHESLLEIKTRAQRRPLRTSEVIYQLWFGQLQHLRIGYHNRGAFLQVDTKNVLTDGSFRRFEHSNKPALGRLVDLIDTIKESLKDSGVERAVLLYENGKLQLYKRRGDVRALPTDLLSKWI